MNYTKLKQNILGLWRILSSGRRRQVVYLVIMIGVSSALDIITIGAVVPFLKVVLEPNSFSEFTKYIGFNEVPQMQPQLLVTVLFMLCVLVSVIFRIFTVWAHSYISQLIGHELVLRAFRLQMYSSLEQFRDKSVSNLTSIITNKINMIVMGFIFPGLTLISTTFFVLISFLLVSYLFPYASLFVCLLLFGFYYSAMRLTAPFLKNNGLRVSDATTKLFRIVNEGFAGIRDIRIAGSRDRYINDLQKADLHLRRGLIGNQLLGAVPRYVVEGLALSIFALVGYYFSSSNSINLASEIPVFAAMALAIQRLLPMLQHAYAAWAALTGVQSVVSDVLAHTHPSVPVSNCGDSEFEVTSDLQLCVRDLAYQFLDAEIPVLNNINLNIAAGDWVAIIGTSGAGKSTLCDIILGLYPPTEGNVAINGRNLTTCNSFEWHRNVGYVPQEVFIINGSILENITFAIDNFDNKKLNQALKVACLESLIAKLPDGAATKIGDGGLELSGGQKQRISIARAVYKNSKLIVFDEATSAVDPKNTAKILKNLKENCPNIALLSITHNLATLKYFDRIYVLKNGTLKEQAINVQI